MKSRTSSCKAAALRKDLSRFWPVWVGYGLFLMLYQGILTMDDMSYWYAANIGTAMSVMGVVGGIYALLVAQMLFGDLFSPRMCNGIHCLPLKREHWFSAHITAGFLFSLIPTAVMVPFSEAIIYLYSEMIDSWQLPLYWFAATNLQYIFFFSLAVFAVMCTGNRFAAAILYGIFNFASLLIYLMVDQLYTPLLKGVVTTSTVFYRLCPMAQLTALRFVDPERVETGKTYVDVSGIEQREYIGRFDVMPEGWIYAAIIAVVGIVLLLAARQMYKKRHLECAGDFLAVHWLEPVFQVVFTVLCGSCFHAVFLIFFGLRGELVYFIMAIGMIVGWFAGRMMIERTTRVFRLRNILGFALTAAAVALSLFVTAMDPLGIATWVPEAETVKYASLSLRYNSIVEFEMPEEMADLIRLHEIALEQDVTVSEDYDSYFYNDNDDDPDAARVELTYVLENGMTARRQYFVLVDSEGGEIIRKYCSRLEAVIFNSYIPRPVDLQHSFRHAENVHVHGRAIPAEYLTEEFLVSLADAVMADCKAGNMVQLGVFHPGIIMEGYADGSPTRMLNLDVEGQHLSFYVDIYADSENIMAVLEPTGILETIRQDILAGRR